MGDAQLSNEPTRNLIVSSTPSGGYKAQDGITSDQQSSTSTPPVIAYSNTERYTSTQVPGNSNMAIPMAQQPYAAQQPRYAQQVYIPASYMQQRAASVGHQGHQGMFNMTSMQRSLPVYPQQQQQQQQQGAQPSPHSQPRFQTGPSSAAAAYQLPQQHIQQFQSGSGVPASNGGQYYHVSGFQQPYFDLYAQYVHSPSPQGQQDPQLQQQQQQQGAYYSSSYPPQYSQSAGPTQTHFAPQWYSPPQLNGYYYVPPTFVAPQVPTPQVSQQMASSHQQAAPIVPYTRRPSIPARQSPPKRRGSETDAAVAFVGYPGVSQWDGRGLGEYSLRHGQPARVSSGQNHPYPPASFPMYLELSRSNSSGIASGTTTNVNTPGDYGGIVSPNSLHPGMPRGPPRKPKQSGHALWVGNLPAGTQVVDLKDYFSRDARNDIESVFLISKSNCAFVNYRTEQACNEAMARFHDSRFQNTRLVCRLRRNSAASSTVGAATPSPEPSADPSSQASGDEGTKEAEGETRPESTKSPPIGPGGARASSRETGRDRIFIVKSLTVEDLDLSVRNGIWATQSHNETALNQAFESADNVYLIFSANKSGEYYGYARMTSPILEDPSNVIEWAPSTQQLDDPDLPKAIYTPATETAPQGRIIDDSARGTIFWEALSDDEAPESGSHERGESDETGEKATVVSKSWGKPFKVEWMSTARVPFYRTRGLRNLWNANREVKIARDGTELEETVGKRLMQMFHRNNGGIIPSAVSGGHLG